MLFFVSSICLVNESCVKIIAANAVHNIIHISRHVLVQDNYLLPCTFSFQHVTRPTSSFCSDPYRMIYVIGLRISSTTIKPIAVADITSGMFTLVLLTETTESFLSCCDYPNTVFNARAFRMKLYKTRLLYVDIYTYDSSVNKLHKPRQILYGLY